MNDNMPVCMCKIPPKLQKNQMYEAIAAYVRNIPVEQRTADDIYEKRLAICSECEALVGGLTCKYCGCFVLARARKDSQQCPMPGRNCWE
ncbi:MAG: hypothetical protein J6B06_08700 [Lachnospiraceae bacterium]|nr:hypothetical protein [Lachnospiraceae bacterium]